jgi:predicted HTH domain antitoxin
LDFGWIREKGAGEMSETIQFEVSQDILAALKIGKKDFARYASLAAALACFKEKKLSLGKAARLAGYNRLDFMDILSDKGIVVFDYDDSFVESELKGVAILSAIDE